MTLPAGKPFHNEFLMFPDFDDGLAFTNDVALLMGFAMGLPTGNCGASDSLVQVDADICITQFIEAFRRARNAHLLDTTNVSTMIFINISYMMMLKLRALRECGLLDEKPWRKARNVYKQLCDSLDIAASTRLL